MIIFGTVAVMRKAFTPRACEVISWIAKGKTDWQTGEILMISAKTVNYHVECLKRKLRVSTRSQVVLAAARCGVLATELTCADGTTTSLGSLGKFHDDGRPKCVG